MSNFQPSKYQQAIFDWIKNGQGSAVIEAVAGSGKSTSLVHALKLIDPKQSVVFVAFNKKIVEELQARVPGHVNCMTMNSMGMRVVNSAFGRANLDAKKTSNLLKDMSNDGTMSFGESSTYWATVSKLVSKAKAHGLVPKSWSELATAQKIAHQVLLEDTFENWIGLIERYEIAMPEDLSQPEDAVVGRVIDLAREALKRSIQMTNIIDFDDQLYLPVVYKLKFPKYDWVFIDEAQDISSIQHVMLERSLNKGGRLVAVGDSHQAIYSFRGADSNSLNKIVETFNCIRLPLSISYRCPKSVVAEAKQYVPHIEAAPTASEGSVVDSGVANNVKLYNPEESVMVVCRNNAPLLRLAYFLIAAKVPVRVEGREIGEGLANLIKKLRARTIHDLGPRLEEWHARETTKKLAVDKSADLSAIDDKYECLLCLLESTQAQTVPELINEVKNLFDPKPGKKYVICSTIHRAKGLESEKVFFLDSWRLPSKYAKTEEQLQQEHNLAYVAVTRAKQSLHYVNFPKEAK